MVLNSYWFKKQGALDSDPNLMQQNVFNEKMDIPIGAASTTPIYFITQRSEKTILSFSRNNLETIYEVYTTECKKCPNLLNKPKIKPARFLSWS